MIADWKHIADDKEKYQVYLCSREWSELRELVRRRCADTCERCLINSMDSCHHLTYSRKYNEKLEDLCGICKGCHEFTHGKSSIDPAREQLSTRIPVYLAGKIRLNCWRHGIVANLRTLVHGFHNILSKDGVFEFRKFLEVISVDVGSRVLLFDYVGPFFVMCDHGCGHGEHSHGLNYDQTCDSSPAPDKDIHRRMVACACVKAIRQADLCLAWIDSLDAYGTLAEIGVAAESGSCCYVGFADEALSREMWFIRSLFSTSSGMCVFPSADEFVQQSVKSYYTSQRFRDHYFQRLMGVGRL
jgi:hypothetical protein